MRQTSDFPLCHIKNQSIFTLEENIMSTHREASINQDMICQSGWQKDKLQHSGMDGVHFIHVYLKEIHLKKTPDQKEKQTQYVLIGKDE